MKISYFHLYNSYMWTVSSTGVFENLSDGILDEDHDDKTASSDKEVLSEKQRHQLKHRELFLSRQVETLPATHIRGKCAITLLNETESFLSYLSKEARC